MSDLAKVVGQRIRDLRTQQGVTQAALAQAIGLSRSSVANVEAGAQALTTDGLHAAAQHFGVRMSVLLGEEDMPTFPQITIQVSYSVHCNECGLLDEDVTQEEAERQRADHIAVHRRVDAKLAAATPPSQPVGAAVIPLPAGPT